jgi:hypothetical protein
VLLQLSLKGLLNFDLIAGHVYVALNATTEGELIKPVFVLLRINVFNLKQTL